MERTNKTIIAITSTAVFFIAVWCMDLSVTSMINGMELTNGFFNTSPVVMYHVALYVMMLDFFIIALIYGGNEK